MRYRPPLKIHNTECFQNCLRLSLFSNPIWDLEAYFSLSRIFHFADLFGMTYDNNLEHNKDCQVRLDFIAYFGAWLCKVPNHEIKHLLERDSKQKFYRIGWYVLSSVIPHFLTF